MDIIHASLSIATLQSGKMNGIAKQEKMKEERSKGWAQHICI